DRQTRDLDAGQLAAHALVADWQERVAPDIGCLFCLVNQPLGPRLVYVIFQCHVGTPVEDAGLDAANVGRAGWADVVRLARIHDSFPQLVAAAAVAEIDLVTHLAGPAGARYHDRDAIESGF